MTAFAALTLKNNAGTDVVFNPLTIDQTGVASWATSDARFDAKSIVTVSTKTPSARQPKARIKLKVTVPVMDAIDTTKKIDEIIATCEIAIPKNSDSTLRANARKHIETLLAHAVSTTFVTSFEGVY